MSMTSDKYGNIGNSCLLKNFRSRRDVHVVNADWTSIEIGISIDSRSKPIISQQ